MTPVSPPHRAPVRRALGRALRGRCPACGLGHVFEHGFVRATRCDTCGWLFERGRGHWIGGSEINMIVTYWAACLTFVTITLVWGSSAFTLAAAGAFTVGFSLLIHRPCRCLFVALDHLIDPAPDPSEDTREDDDDRRRDDDRHGPDDRGDDPPPVPYLPGGAAARPDRREHLSH